MQDSKILQTAETDKMLAAAVEKANELGVALSIAITDAGGNLLAFKRMDGATAMTAKISIQKAWTSAMSGHPTAFWMDRVKDNPGLLSFPDLVSMQGGLPVKLGELCIGAVGASGAAPELDEAAAQAAIDAIT